MNTTWIFEKEKERKRKNWVRKWTGWQFAHFILGRPSLKKSPCNRCCLSLLQVWLSCYLRAKKSREESAKGINLEREKLGMVEEGRWHFVPSCGFTDGLITRLISGSFLRLLDFLPWFIISIPYLDSHSQVASPTRKKERERKKKIKRKKVSKWKFINTINLETIKKEGEE